MIHERAVRTDPNLRADRFVERWNRYSHAAEQAYVTGDISQRRAYQDEMRNMAKSLERDPQIESILANRKRERNRKLGIAFDSGCRLGAELAFNHGIDMGAGARHG